MKKGRNIFIGLVFISILCNSCIDKKNKFSYYFEFEKVGLLSSSGIILSPPIFDRYSEVKNGKIWVRNKKACAIIDEQGANVLVDSSLTLLPLIDDQYYAKKENERIVIIKFDSEEDKKYLDENIQRIAEQFYNNRLQVRFENGNEGFIDRDARITLNIDVDLLYNYSNNIAVAQRKDSVLYFDINGKLLFSYKGNGSPFSEKLSLIDQGGSKIFIDQNGEIVLDCSDYESVGSFYNGLASVKKEGTWGYINKKGKLVIPLQYSHSEDFIKGIAAVQQGESTDSWFFIDTKGRKVFEDSYSYIMKGFVFGGIIALVRNDQFEWFYINTKGEKILDTSYDPLIEPSISLD